MARPIFNNFTFHFFSVDPYEVHLEVDKQYI